MIAHIDHVLDYMNCPMAYKFRYIDRIDPSTRNHTYEKYDEQSIYEIFDREIHKIGYHIFNYMQDGRYPSEYLLRQKWSTIWCKNKTKEDILFESNAVNGIAIMKKMEDLGVKDITNMHPKYKTEAGVPILVGKTVEVEIGKHRIQVVIDLVQEIEVKGERLIEIVNFKTGLLSRRRSQDKPTNLHIGRDLEMTVVSLAFQQMTGHKEDRITYYDMINDREHITRRTEEDHQLLEGVLNQVERAITAEIYYPVMDHRCLECPFQFNCRRENWYKRGDKDD